MKSEAQLSAEIERLQRSVEEQSRELNSKNRELEIEAALERVRTASMSMHKSDDLLLVIKTVHDQITELGIKVDASNFQTYIENSRDFYLWAITTTHSYQQKIKVTHIDFGMTKQMWDAWEKGDSFVELRSDADEMHRWWKKAFEVSELRHTPQHRREIILSAPGWNSIVVRKKTCGLQLHRYNLERFTEQEKDILKRLATVFEQSYTRFLDLQKAEKQAREAEIEAGLERVRSASMAMHRSEELEKVVEVTFRQLQSLALPIDGCQLITFEDQSKDFHFWSATPDMIYPTRLNIPYFDHPIFSKFWAARERGDTFISFDLTRQETLDFYNHLYENTNLGISVTKDRWERIQSIEHGFKTSWGIQKNTGLWVFNFTNHQFTEEENSLIERFSKVFEQTYTRFLDLQKAEAQAREAQIEAALERVRARSIGMQKSKELGEVVHLMDTEVHGLGIMTDNVSIITDFSEIGKGVSNWFASRGKIYLQKFHIPFSKSDTPTLKLYKVLAEGVEYYSEVYSKQEKDKYFKWLFKNSDYKRLPEESKLFVLNTPGWTRAIVPSKNSVLIFQRFKVEIFKEEEIAIFKRFAKVFEQTYTRFLDLQKAEAQAKEAEIQLALERVRARTMAMQHSDELKEVVAVVFEKLIELGFGLKNGAAIIHIFNNDSKDHIEWVADPTQVFPRGIDMPFFENPLRSDMFNAWQSGIKYYSKEYSREIKDDFFAFTFQHTDYKFIDNEIKEVIRKTEKYSYTIAFGKNTAIGIPDTTGRLFTTQEEEILTRFAKVFEQTYTRFLDLKKAEAQAREAQIEAGLERVRSKAMAMHDSSDLANANSVVFNELNSLGISPLRSGIGLIDAETREGIMNATVRSDQGNNLLLIGKISLKDNEILESIFDHWVKKKIYCPKLNGQELNQYYDLILAGYGDLPKPKFSKNEVQYGYFLPFKHGSFYAWTKEPFSEEELKTIQRFVSVIDLTYNRYFDLKKAEALARESQIEAALERIRSRSMAMHKTSELSEVIILLFKQFENLNLVIDTCFIDIFDEDNQGFNFWIGTGTAIYPKQTTLPYFEHPIHQLTKNARKNGLGFFTFDEDKKSKDAFFKHFYLNAEGIDVPKSRKEFIAKGLGISGSAAMGKYSGITMFNYQKIIYSKEENDILIRVNKVFQQTYTRFLDLKKAEAQAREAQIEAALEKVRSSSLAMHSPKDLEKVVIGIVKRLQELGVILDANGITLCTYFQDSKNVLHWIASPDFSFVGSYLLPYFEHPIFREAWESRESGAEYFSKSYSIEEKNSFFKHAFEHSDYKYFPEEFKQWIFQNDKHTLSFAWQKNSAILIPSNTGIVPNESEKAILIRFSKVFEQAYVRFMDLQKAEAREKEAIKQSSLDRVRAEIASMRNTEDLQRITPLIWRELLALDVPFFRCGLMIVDEKEEKVHFYLSTPDGKPLAALNLDFESSDISSNGVKHWKKQQTYIAHWNKEEFLAFTKTLLEQQQIENLTTYQGGEAPPESLTLQFIPFPQGMLYVGSKEDLSPAQIDLVQNLADAFSVAYARYEDFKQLEDAKSKIELTLSELKSTQAQLIQSEKMASLGELTAGIAHEIQNPLNFVNNFSEVSAELVQELKEEIEKGDLEEVKFIANDLQENLVKINHHGKRAGSIVKGMLEHSRKSEGKKVLIDLNQLADECLRLSFHGLRAKDKTFHADYKTDFDPNLPKVNVVSQDIGRVLLNLINNAFQACAGQSSKGSNPLEGFNPLVTVSTKNIGDKIEISVNDNGPGIPDAIIEKIFQPFFTTKPTGSGTGLGLSLSYDIVKAHGGNLMAKSEEGYGALFIITLPLS